MGRHFYKKNTLHRWTHLKYDLFYRACEKFQREIFNGKKVISKYILEGLSSSLQKSSF
jgi:hypothetical protein